MDTLFSIEYKFVHSEFCTLQFIWFNLLIKRGLTELLVLWMVKYPQVVSFISRRLTVLRISWDILDNENSHLKCFRAPNLEVKTTKKLSTMNSAFFFKKKNRNKVTQLTFVGYPEWLKRKNTWGKSHFLWICWTGFSQYIILLPKKQIMYGKFDSLV